MRIDPLLIDCVAFLCSRNQLGKNAPGGTAFFVEVPDESDSTRKWTYLVTALHCLEDSPGRDIYVRINTLPDVKAEFDYEDKPTRKDDWFKHWNADVAAIVAPYDPARHAIQRIPLDTFIDRDYRLNIDAFNGRANRVLEPMLREHFKTQGGIPVEVGQDLFFPGLFVQSAGKNRNLPIVRFGNISRMPGEELIKVKSRVTERRIRAYVAECRSIGGHSGSPVFWHYEYNIGLPLNVPLWRPPQSSLLIQKSEQPQRVDVQVRRGWAMGLLGLVSAHFNTAAGTEIEETIAQVNAGIAVVTPAENIRELLMSEEVKEDRARRAAQMKDDQPAAIADFAPAKQRSLASEEEDRIDMPIPTKKQFFGDLTKATRRRKKPS